MKGRRRAFHANLIFSLSPNVAGLMRPKNRSAMLSKRKTKQANIAIYLVSAESALELVQKAFRIDRMMDSHLPEDAWHQPSLTISCGCLFKVSPPPPTPRGEVNPELSTLRSPRWFITQNLINQEVLQNNQKQIN